MNRRQGEAQSSSGRGCEEKNSLPLPGIEPVILKFESTIFSLGKWKKGNVDVLFLFF
jgi:hypothetical protein